MRSQGLLAVLGVTTAMVTWALLVATRTLDPDIVPSPWSVVLSITEHRAELVLAAGETLHAWALSLGYALAGGTVLGVLAGWSRWVDALTSGLTRFLRPLPSVALIPVAILVLGLGPATVAVLGAYAAFWPIFLGSFYGVRNLDPLLLDTGRTLGLSRTAFVTRLVVPATLPSILSGVRVAVAVCLVVCVSAEVIIGNRGLGGFVVAAQYGANTAAVYAGIVAGGLLGWSLSVLFGLVQRSTVGWAMRSAS